MRHEKQQYVDEYVYLFGCNRIKCIFSSLFGARKPNLSKLAYQTESIIHTFYSSCAIASETPKWNKEKCPVKPASCDFTPYFTFSLLKIINLDLDYKSLQYRIYTLQYYSQVIFHCK